MLAHFENETVYYLKKQASFHSMLETIQNYFRLQDDELQQAILQDNAQIFEVYQFGNLDELLGFELTQMALHKCNVKRYSYCAVAGLSHRGGLTVNIAIEQHQTSASPAVKSALFATMQNG